MERASVLDILGAVRGVTIGLVHAAPDLPVTGERVVGVEDSADATFGAVSPFVMIRPAKGPIAALVVDASERLVDALAPGISRTPPTTPGADAPGASSPRGRLLSLSERIERELDEAAAWYEPREVSPAAPSPGELRAALSRGAFGYEVETARGSLRVLVVLAVVERPIAAGDAMELGVSREARRALLAELAAGHSDAQIQLPEDRFDARLHDARFLSSGNREPGQPLLLASPALVARRHRDVADWQLPVFVVHRARLLRLDSRAVALIDLPVGGDATLPVLALVPERVERGQRRAAFRVVPVEPLRAQVLAAHATSSADSSEGVEVRDLSFTGGRLANDRSEPALDLDVGARARVRIGLPDGYGAITLPAVVRSVRDVEGRRPVRVLGIEFLAGGHWRRYDESVAVLRRFVMDEQRRQLERDAA